MSPCSNLRSPCALVSLLVPLLGAILSGEARAAAQVCGGATGPDLAVAEIGTGVTFGALGAESAYSFGTTLANYGTQEASWAASTTAHPFVVQNLYRLEDGRFEHLGQSWGKHEFAALQQGTVCTCMPAGSVAALGVGCATPSSASIMGSQQQLGPRSEVNPVTGAFPVPFGSQGQTGDLLYKRLQASTSAVDPAPHPSASFFVEVQVVAADDALAGNRANNVSWRALNRSGATANGAFRLDPTGATHIGAPALAAWQLAAPNVALHSVDVPGDGRIWVASDCLPLPNGRFRYEYAVFVQDSARGVGAFSVPIGGASQVSGAGMGYARAHSGEPYADQPWTAVALLDRVRWSTTPASVDPDANAVRWGTTHSFWFEAASAPTLRPAELELFLAGGAPDPQVTVWAPAGTAPTATVYCAAAPNSTGAPGTIEARDYDTVLGRMTLVSDSLPTHAAAYSLVSRAPGFAPQPGGSAGNLCLSGPIGRRVGGAVLNTGSGGTFVEVADLGALPQPAGAVAVLPGETWHFQVWHRDSVGGAATSNFTPGLAVQFP
jgi:hypothetical protein